MMEKKGQCKDFTDASTAVLINVTSIQQTIPRTQGVLLAPDADAVILYTSGSTGKPKGVPLKHSSLFHQVELCGQVLGLGSDSVVLRQSSFGFDMSVLQMFLGLALEGRVCMIPDNMRGDSVTITDLIMKEGVTFTCATPSEYTSWLRYVSQGHLRNSKWSTALSGGEGVTRDLLSLFRALAKHDLRLFNGYGPTETTCCSSITELRYKDRGIYPDEIPAGRALPNESIYIIDEQMRIMPPGFPGEISIGGVGVASGYLNNKTQTDNSFLLDPFVDEDYLQKGWTKMYRTGDRGRLLADGSLVVEGRVCGDTEIKLRGMRVDLRDVEQAIMSAGREKISEVVVSSRQAGSIGGESLVGHVVLAPGSTVVDVDTFFKDLLAELPLPEYMCPSLLVPVTVLPKTTSSKLDRAAAQGLPTTLQAGIYSTTLSLLSTSEARLKEIWLGVLSSGAMSEISTQSDFFPVGGTSMLLVGVQAEIRNALGVFIPLVQLFSSSTLQAMARLVSLSLEGNRWDNGQEENVSIDWDDESRPIIDAPQPAVSGNAIQSPPKTILLTGAAGNLGAAILEYFLRLESPVIQDIVCIAVRNVQKRLDAGHLPRDMRITYHEGDLRLPLMGLSKEEASKVFDRVDVVIHSAAEVSHLKSYSSLKAVNVSSTKELVRLCAPRRIHLHYISTAQVATLGAPRETFGEISARDSDPGNGADGYAASKWVSERLLERSSEEADLPVVIHRPSSIMHAADSHEKLTGSQMNLIQAVLRYSRVIQAVPVVPSVRGMLDFVSAENAVASIVSEVLNGTREGVAYVHQTRDLKIPVNGLKGFLDAESDETVEHGELDVGEWADRAEAAGLDAIAAAAIRRVKDLDTLSFPHLIKAQRQ